MKLTLNTMTEKAVLISTATLSFTQAMTLDIGWPIKIYEVVLLFMLGIWLIGAFKFPFIADLKKEVTILLLFVGVLIFSTMVNLMFYKIEPAVFIESRFGVNGNSISKLAYIIFVVLSFILVLTVSVKASRKMIQWWLYGAVISACYGWYLFIFSGLGKKVFLLPGIINTQLISVPVGSGLFIRMGTFVEGNYAGAFLLLSMILAFHVKSKKIGYFLFFSIFTTFSTINISLALLYFLIMYYRAIRHKLNYAKMILFILILLMLVPVVKFAYSSPVIQTVIINKLVADKESSDAVSRVERLQTSIAGFQMFLEKPIIGVGISRYYLYYDQLYPSVNPVNRIANNVYIEILSESGIICFILFLYFMMRIYKWCYGERMVQLRVGMFILLVVLLAFPTFSIMFIWFFIAIIVGERMRLNPSPKGA